MCYYEKRRRRRRAREHGQQQQQRRARGAAGSPPTFVLAMVLGTVFLAVQWRARLLPHALRVRRARAPPAAWLRMRQAPRARPAAPRARPVSALALAAGLRGRARGHTRRYVPGALYAARAGGIGGGRAAPPREPEPDPGVNLTGAAAGCRTYLCGQWAGLPARVALPRVPRAELPWVHGSRGAHVGADSGLAGAAAESSIFGARRKGPWMGCARRDALLCTGLYRALKRTGAASLFDADCGLHLEWLPRILEKLLREYRLVRVTCAVRGPHDALRARQALSGARVAVVQFFPAAAAAADFPRADVVFARESLRRANLIGAMALLRKVKASGRFRFLVHENFPRASANVPRPSGLLLNAALPPFSLPPPFYSHAAAADDAGPPGAEVACRAVADMFEQRATPTMDELVDPRRRQVLE